MNSLNNNNRTANKTSKGEPTIPRNDGSRYMWLGFVAGLLCMVALVMAGIVTESAGMIVMASSVAAVLAATWSSTAVALKKKAARSQVD